MVQLVYESASFLKNRFSNFKIHLFSILNTKQTNDGIFSDKAWENFDMAEIFLNVRARLSDIYNAANQHKGKITTFH